MLKDLCTVSNSEQPDDFVGLRFIDGKPNVFFPRGFHLLEDEKTLRRDIVRLLAAINQFTDRYEGENPRNNASEQCLDMPIQSYQYIIFDFIAHGYYTENEVRYVENTRGKINWKRTIQKEHPQINNGNVVYLNFITKVNKINDNNLITKIHEYCVYESFQKLGWLFLSSDALPKKPTIKFNKKAFLSVLKQELTSTFNVQKKMLFQSMINIINQTHEKLDDRFNASFGVYRFEYIWEGMIDYVFGETNKEEFFPHAEWHIVTGKGYRTESSALEPDTIISVDDKIYVIDAKYYKFGVTRNPLHLPASSSIEKQIVYGEYIEQNKGISADKIYNAFVMPYDGFSNEKHYEFVSVGTGQWKEQTKNYEYVLGILMDTRYIINSYAKHNLKEIDELTELIETSLTDYLNQ